MKKILVLSTYEITLSGMLNTLYELGCDCVGARNEAEALKAIEWFQPHLLVVTLEVEDVVVEKIAAHFPTLKIQRHKAGVSGLTEFVLN